jgi:hypothetical protein
VAAQKLLDYEAKNGCPYSVEDATIGTANDCTDDDDENDLRIEVKIIVEIMMNRDNDCTDDDEDDDE